MNSRTIEEYVFNACRDAVRHLDGVALTSMAREAININIQKVLSDYLNDGRISEYSQIEVSQNSETGLTDVSFMIRPTYAMNHVNISFGFDDEFKDPVELRLSFEF